MFVLRNSVVDDVGSVGDNDFGVVKLKKKNSQVIYGVDSAMTKLRADFGCLRNK